MPNLPKTILLFRSPEHLPLSVNHQSEKKMLKFNRLEHFSIGKVIQFFRNML